MRGQMVIAVSMLVVAPAQGQEVPLLAGPRVAESERRTGVGESRYAEGMTLDRVRPEVAALEVLGLDAEDRAEADRVLAARAAIIDRVVLARVAEFTRIEAAAANRDFVTLWSIYSEFYESMDPLWARGPLADELRAALPERVRPAYDERLAEYERALVERERAKSEAKGKQFSPFALRIQRHFQTLQVEIEASTQRTLESGEREFEALLANAQLTSGGEAVVRAGVLELIERVGFQPTDTEFAVALQGILAELEPPDRRSLVAAIRTQYARPD